MVWCGVLLSTCRCRGGPCPWSFLLRLMSFLQRGRAERSMKGYGFGCKCVLSTMVTHGEPAPGHRDVYLAVILDRAFW